MLRHLQEAMDKVRKREYARLSGPGRRFVKGQRFALLSRWRNLSYTGKQGLRLLFNANKRLYTAYLLKESFEQLWDYEVAGWARRFFENWRDALKWQRLKPHEKFAAMIDAHWDGIVAYCLPQNKVALGSSRPEQQVPRAATSSVRYRDEEFAAENLTHAAQDQGIRLVLIVLPLQTRRAKNLRHLPPPDEPSTVLVSFSIA